MCKSVTAVALLCGGIYYDLHIENVEEINVKTFLQRKILRTKLEAERQKYKVDMIDKQIESHYKSIKQLKAAQSKRNDLSTHLYASIGYLINRLSPKEKYTLFEGEK